MYKIPKEIKKVIYLSFIISLIAGIILLIINPLYALAFMLGYIASLLSLIKNCFVSSILLYGVTSRPKLISVSFNLLSYIIYMIALGFSFLKGLVPGLFGVLGVFIIKSIIIILYGRGRKEGDCS